MPLGIDKQFNATFSEQDKIYRRLEIKNRLKAEGIRKRYDPFLQIKGVIFSDPALERYLDMRKKGRLPGTPIKPSLFVKLLGGLVIPIVGLAYLITWERKDYLEQRSRGDYPMEKLYGKSML